MIKFRGPVKTRRDVARFLDLVVADFIRIHPEVPSVEFTLEHVGAYSKADEARFKELAQQCEDVPGIDMPDEITAAILRFGTQTFSDRLSQKRSRRRSRTRRK